MESPKKGCDVRPCVVKRYPGHRPSLIHIPIQKLGAGPKIGTIPRPFTSCFFLHVWGATMTCFECNFGLVWVLDSDLLNMLVTAVSKGSSSRRVNLFAPK